MKSTMKRIVSATVAAAMLVAMSGVMSGCGTKYEKAYDYNLSDYIKVGNYMGVEYTAYTVEVSDEEVENEMDTELQSYAEQTDATGPIQNGDYVNITYELEVEGEAVEGTGESDYNIEVGAGSVLDDIDKALVGHEAGDEFTVETTFPENYEINTELSGKHAKFDITINSHFNVKYPEVTDEWVAKHLDYDTEAEWRQAVYDELYADAKDEADYNAELEIWNKIVSDSELIAYPDGEVDAMKESLKSSFQELCDYYGIELEDAIETLMETDEEGYQEQLLESAQVGVKERLVLYTIARENDLDYTDKEYSDYLDSMLELNDMTAKEFKETYEETIEQYAEEQSIRENLVFDRVFEFLLENGVAVEGDDSAVSAN